MQVRVWLFILADKHVIFDSFYWYVLQQFAKQSSLALTRTTAKFSEFLWVVSSSLCFAQRWDMKNQEKWPVWLSRTAIFFFLFVRYFAIHFETKTFLSFSRSVFLHTAGFQTGSFGMKLGGTMGKAEADTHLLWSFASMHTQALMEWQPTHSKICWSSSRISSCWITREDMLRIVFNCANVVIDLQPQTCVGKSTNPVKSWLRLHSRN